MEEKAAAYYSDMFGMRFYSHPKWGIKNARINFEPILSAFRRSTPNILTRAKVKHKK